MNKIKNKTICNKKITKCCNIMINSDKIKVTGLKFDKVRGNKDGNARKIY